MEQLSVINLSDLKQSRNLLRRKIVPMHVKAHIRYNAEGALQIGQSTYHNRKRLKAINRSKQRQSAAT